MGTRADFYIGRGKSAEWLGSIRWDGYPSDIAPEVLGATSEADYRAAVSTFFSKRKDVTLPEDGWPWPWEGSRTTDYAYAFDGGAVHASCLGHAWFDPLKEEPGDSCAGEKVAAFPDMSAV